MKLKKFNVGEHVRRFPVRTWNHLVSVAESQAVVGSMPQTSAPASPFPNTCIVQVKNTTGAHRAFAEVIGIGAIAVDANVLEGYRHGVPVLTAVALAETHTIKHAVLLQSLGVDQIGAAAIANALWAKVDIGSADHDFVTLDPANYRYKSSNAGTPIIAKPSGTGVKWCVISLGSGASAKTFYWGIADEDSETGTDPFAVTVTDGPDGDDLDPQPPGLEWHNPMKLPFGVGDIVYGELTDPATGDVNFIQSERHWYDCEEEAPALVIDGGNSQSANYYDAPNLPAPPGPD